MSSYLDSYHEAFEVARDCDPIELLDGAIDKSIIIPSKAIQKPIMVACAIMPSVNCSILPLCINYGKSGTGKSTFGKLVHGIWGLDERFLLAGKTTPTAIRNMLMSQKYGSDWMEFEDDLPTEKNAVLIWDDIDPKILQDTLIQSILKSGYSRKTANLGIAQQGGVNQYYNFFSSKFTSTIHPIWVLDELKELKRRSLVFSYKPYETLGTEDKSDNPHIDDLIDIDYVDFEDYNGSSKLYLDLAEIEETKTLARSLRQKLRYAQFPRWYGKLCFDVITVGTTLGVFSSLSDAISCFELFWRLQDEVLKEKTEFQIFIERLIEDEINTQSQLVQVKELDYPIEILRSNLQRRIDKAIKEKEIPSEKYNLREVMKEFGFDLTSEQGSMKFIKEIK